MLRSVTECYRELQSISSASTWTNFWACFSLRAGAGGGGVSFLTKSKEKQFFGHLPQLGEEDELKS